MPRILITGNGFDLHHNLPTAYKDFIKVTNYVINNTDYNFDAIYANTSIKDFKIHFPNEIVIDSSLINELKQIAENNLFFKYFSEELELETWIDFETKIEFILKNIYRGIKCIRSVVKLPIKINIETFENNISGLEIFEFFKILKANPRAKNSFHSRSYSIENTYSKKKNTV